MSEHVILVAFEVEDHGGHGTLDVESRARAELALQQRLIPLLQGGDPSSPIVAWWVAEDDRRDGSDLDSAVFVSKGRQRAARDHVQAYGLAPFSGVSS